MTLRQLAVLIDAENPKRQRADEGTFADLLMFAKLGKP